MICDSLSKLIFWTKIWLLTQCERHGLALVNVIQLVASVLLKMNTKLVVRAIMLGILYLILMIIFALFYMHDQLIDFFEARTTITSRIVQAKSFEFPSLIVCMNPARKMSIAEKYGFKESNDVFYQDVPNSTLEKRYLIFQLFVYFCWAVCLLLSAICLLFQLFIYIFQLFVYFS